MLRVKKQSLNFSSKELADRNAESIVKIKTTVPGSIRVTTLHQDEPPFIVWHIAWEESA